MKILLKVLNLLLGIKKLIVNIILIIIFINTVFFIPEIFSKNINNEKNNSAIEEKDISSMSYFVRFYQKFISVFDGDRCPMYPSCSQYSLQCFKKHGFILGWIMTCDRLLHEPDEMNIAPIIIVDGKTLYFDPVEENDKWLK